MTEQTRMYGRVLYELHLPEKMVCEMVKVIRENPLLVQILSDPVLPSFKKDRIIEKVWRASEFTEIVPSFLKKVCAAGCIGSMDSILSVWEQCLRDEKGIIQAELFLRLHRQMRRNFRKSADFCVENMEKKRFSLYWRLPRN